MTSPIKRLLSIHTTKAKSILSRIENQCQIVEAATHHDLTFMIRMAGTGKTYLSMALAYSGIAKQSRRQDHCSPTYSIVEAGKP